ncbi:MAG: DUF924 family protein [Pseudomonadota bacterium]
MRDPKAVLKFWFEELTPQDWYTGGDALDNEIRTLFQQDWEDVSRRENSKWICRAKERLAYLLLLDQFPRNMFRGTAKAFSTDRKAVTFAKSAIARKQDIQIKGDARQFMYMPLMHSESLQDQELSVRLFLAWEPKGRNLPHALAHRDIIREFGRFPARNEALGRTSSAKEIAYLESGGYRKTVEKFPH